MHRLGVVLALAGAIGGLGLAGDVSARPLATTNVLVQAIGQGTVSGIGINCGQGATTCYLSTSQSGSIALTATAAGGWTFAGWDANSLDCQGTGTCSVPANGQDHVEYADFSSPDTTTSTLTVNVPLDASGKGGSVTDTPPAQGGINLSCGSSSTSCAWSALTGSTLTVIEEPDTGYTFGGWSGACSGSGKTCTVNLTADKTVNATFVAASQTFPLSVTVSGSGTVSGGGVTCTSAGGSDCTANEASGSTVTLTEAPDSGSTFTGWGGACSGTAKTCIVTMNAAKTVSATFSSGPGGGGGGGGTNTTQVLSVSVTGSGEVSGGGISCGNGSTACSASETTGSTVTLTATPSSAATFSNWGGACSGAKPTCSVTMSANRSVTATFSGGTSAKSQLSVRVIGKGAVKGPGIDCGSGHTTCSAGVTDGSTVTLTAAPVRGGRFLGWSGACTGAKPACTLVVKNALSVTARFSGTGTTAAVLKSRGRPIVGRFGSAYRVTLRFGTAQAGTARIYALRAGRVVTALRFGLAAGPATIGPFPVGLPGYYTFEVRLGSSSIRWNACLGRCGAAAPPSAGAFAVESAPPTITPTGSAWRVTLHFTASRPANAQVRAFRGERLLRNFGFAASAGRNIAPPFLLGAGTYRLTVTAIDAFGRVRRLTWFAVLH